MPANTAIKISGRTGRHSLINTTYEPMECDHNDKPCWVARNAQPSYVFHTGKNRWVISKRIDDGARCWAYVQGAASPIDAGPWVCCDPGNEWNEDPNVACVAVPMSRDKFVELRMSLHEEMSALKLFDPKYLKTLWRKLDYNGNNIVSLAEIDKMVVELVAGGVWDEWLNNKPALMRAYKKTCLVDGDGDDWVEKKEFNALLLNIFWFNKLFLIFDNIGGQDRRISVHEFVAGISKLGLYLNRQEAEEEFAKIDRNHGGQVLFVEFCAYIRKRVNPDANPAFDADIYSGEHCGKSMRKHAGHKATHTHMVKKKCFKEFDELEAKIKHIISDKKKLRDLWHRIDFNGNNIVSLAEIDKLAVEAFPLLNHKPALMRAYKRTLKQGDGDDWVQKKEFKNLLANLFYYNKIFWLFDEVDGGDGYGDRRMDIKEFKQVMVNVGCPMKGAELEREFKEVDRNGGGIILFDEFCRWFTSKKCPEAMSEFVE